MKITKKNDFLKFLKTKKKNYITNTWQEIIRDKRDKFFRI
jgi:hypothetical protein